MEELRLDKKGTILFTQIYLGAILGGFGAMVWSPYFYALGLVLSVLAILDYAIYDGEINAQEEI
jgi:hypothetical protein